MQPHRQPMFFFLILALFVLASASAATTAAQSLPPSPPDPVPAAAPPEFGHLFLSYSEDSDSHPWWQSQTLVDDSGGVHVAYYSSESKMLSEYIASIHYAYCPGQCADLSNWSRRPISLSGRSDSLAYPALALDPNGHPRLMWNNGSNFVYAECSTNCAQAGIWKKVVLDFSPVEAPKDARYFVLDGLGRPRFVSPYYKGITYAYCDAACTTAASWHTLNLDFGGWITELQLSMANNNQPRVIGINLNSQLEIMLCSAGCTTATNWSHGVIASGVGNGENKPTYSLRLDSLGRPRVAFYKPGVNDLYYGWSDSNFTTTSTWKFVTLPYPPADERTVDLAIDTAGRPHLVIATKEYDLRYIRCTAQCITLAPVWEAQNVETGAGLDQIAGLPRDSGSWGSRWWMDGFASLDLDSSNNPYISYSATHVQYINSALTDYYNDAWSIRFATSGSGPAPTYDHWTFLPAVTK